MKNPHRYFLFFLLLLIAGTGNARSEETLRVVSWSGSYVKSQILGFIRPFEEATGIDVEVLQYNGGINEIRSQVRSYNVKWDVVDLELFDAIRACKEDLLVNIDLTTLNDAPDGTPAKEDFIHGSLSDCAVGNVLWSTVLVYDQSKFSTSPTTLEDFFNVKDFPGPRAMRRTPKVNLEWALIADGVPPEKVYDVLETDQGVDRAFQMLSRIKPYIRWWDSAEEGIQWLENGQVAMASMYSGRVDDAVNRGTALKIIWDHQVWFLDVWGIVRNGENVELAKKFVRFATSTESLANQANYIPYGPLRKSSMKLVPDDIRRKLPTAKENFQTAIEGNAEWWAENRERLTARFEEWIDQSVMVPKELPR